MTTDRCSSFCGDTGPVSALRSPRTSQDAAGEPLVTDGCVDPTRVGPSCARVAVNRVPHGSLTSRRGGRRRGHLPGLGRAASARWRRSLRFPARRTKRRGATWDVDGLTTQVSSAPTSSRMTTSSLQMWSSSSQMTFRNASTAAVASGQGATAAACVG